MLFVFGHGRGGYLHVFKITQLAQAFCRAVELGLVVGCAFHLAHFAADDFIAGFVVAADFNLAHRHAVAGVQLHGQIHIMLAVFLAATRFGGYFGAGIACGLQIQFDFG